jgi:ABC-type multidrug transport system fused ATPase/permease subunit
MINLFRLFAYLRKYTSYMVFALIFLAISIVLNLTQPKLIEWAIDSGITPAIVHNIVMGGVGIFLLGVVGNLANLVSGYLFIRSGQGMAHELRGSMFKKVVSFSFINFDKWRTGELMVRLNSDVNTVRMFIRMGLFMIAQSIIMIIGSVVFMFNTDVRLASIMALLMGGTLAFSITFVSFLRPLFLKMRAKLDELNNTLQENLAGAKVVRAFNRQLLEREKFGLKNRGFYMTAIKIGYLFGTVIPFMMFIGNLAITLILWLGGTEIIQNYHAGTTGFTLGQLIAFNNYAMMAIFPLIMLGMVLNFISMASASAERIFQVLKEEPGISTPENPVLPEKITGRIEFDGISFGYGEGEDAVQDVTLTIEPGEKIGIIGGTGSGKSSLASLIPRLYDPRKGRIRIDGIDIKEYDPIELRRKIGIVLQDPILFSGGIRQNILYGNPEGGESVAEWAAKIAQAMPFIDEKGWDGSIGERGTSLSGGQRQRVAIARAVASKPAILILDDVTSSLDLATERNVTKGIYEGLDGITVLIISQKIQTIKMSDRIIVMDKGRISGIGPHDALIQNNEIYRKIAETQDEFIH